MMMRLLRLVFYFSVNVEIVIVFFGIVGFFVSSGVDFGVL